MFDERTQSDLNNEINASTILEMYTIYLTSDIFIFKIIWLEIDVDMNNKIIHIQCEHQDLPAVLPVE